MSIGPLAVIGGIAATPTNQRNAASERTTADAARQQAEAKNDLAAELAAGIGQTEQDEHATNERDADGRLMWQRRKAPPSPAESEPTAAPDEEQHGSAPPLGSEDSSSGHSLDLLV
ncbi:MAG: hypothetical protein SFX18_17280 [Pirellulales bacterium]|nr:hypothetical protein [Pirellulales bacterium]